MFGEIFPNNKRKKQNNHFQSDLEGFFLTKEEFFVRVRQERLRSERSNLPLCLVIMHLDSLLDSLVEKSCSPPRTFLGHLADMLQNSTRQSDVKGWFQEGMIGLLAPDTTESGARALVKKLVRKITDYWDSNDGFREPDVRKFFGISPLQTGLGYLARDQQDKEVEAKITILRENNFLDSAPHLSTPCSSGTLGTVNMAAMERPFALEVTNGARLRNLQFKVKRVIDIVGSLTGILLIGPAMLLIAALIKLTSPGPAIFRQQRVGLLGKPFTFLKFRTMKVDSDPSIHSAYVAKWVQGENDAINKGTAEQPIYKIIDDTRITPFGAFLRKSSLDELPQLFNVLKGDMSLVGPRPDLTYAIDYYKSWHHRRTMEVKPGMTGLWQVDGRCRATWDEVVRMDLTYAQTWNLWLDLKIIFKTFRVVISSKGGH